MTLAAMDRYNIVLGFLSHPLDNVFKWVEAAPGRFIASPLVYDPAAVDLARLRREYEAGRLGGMGEVASQYWGIAADDPRLEPFFALAEEFDVPVLLHSHGTGAPAERFRIAELLRILRRMSPREFTKPAATFVPPMSTPKTTGSAPCIFAP